MSHLNTNDVHHSTRNKGIDIDIELHTSRRHNVEVLMLYLYIHIPQIYSLDA